MNSADDWLTIKDLAHLLKMSISAATELMHQLPHVTTGKKYGYRVRRAVVDKWTAEQDGYTPAPLRLLKGTGREPA